MILRIPFRSEVKPALLHPILEVAFGDVIGISKQRTIWRNKLHRGFLNTDPVSSDLERKRPDMRQLPAAPSAERTAFRDVVLNDQRTAAMHVIEQPLLIGTQIRPYVISANTGDDGVECP